MFQNLDRRNHQGRSFKGQNLAGADFSHSDIRSADFSGANLAGADFTHAKAGLQPLWVIVMFGVVLLLTVIAGAAAAIDALLPIETLVPKQTLEFNILPLVLTIATNLAFLVLTVHQGVQKALGFVTTGVAGTVILIAILGGIGSDLNSVTRALRAFRFGNFVNAIADGTGSQVANLIVMALATLMSAIALIVALSLAVVVAAIALHENLRTLIVAGAAIGAAIPAGFSAQNTVRYLDTHQLPHLWIVGVVIVIGALVFFGDRIAVQVLAEDEKYELIRQIAIFIAAIGGTSFRGADLSEANFTYATLPSTDFRFANTNRTAWYKAKQLGYAKVDDTILGDRAVRDLVVTRNGRQKSYAGANLRGANLISADLTQANFKTADLTEAALQGACLDWANLTEAQAVGTDFTCAQMTGTCLAAWNIDSTTQLEEVESRFVYLLEQPKPGTDDRERRPSSGEFAPREFTSLFQEVLNTVDLIFRNGIDWKAFMSSFKQVQVENEGTELTIQSIENKGDGVVVVKVAVPPETSKAKIHHEFMQIYDQTVTALEEKYEAELRGKEGQLQLMRQQNASLERIVNYLALRPIPATQTKIASDKLVVLTLGTGDFQQGFAAVKAQIWSDGHSLPTTFTGKLSPQPEMLQLYQQWHQKYENLRLCYKAQGITSRIRQKQTQVNRVSIQDIPQLKHDLQELAKKLQARVNAWLNSEEFSPVQKKLRAKFIPQDRVRLLVQSETIQMRRLPWHLWDFFEDYESAEVALSISDSNRIEKSVSAREKIRILAIMGDRRGINIEADRQFLESLPNAEPVFLVEPDRQELNQWLWDDRGWDILCFSGHSSSKMDGTTGYFQLGGKDNSSIKLEELQKAIKAAIVRGLKLAIFNSCDGLGLAQQLANLNIPQVIVMREPVPDLVAQEFLKNFLRLFSNGKTLYVSVREAREMLQGMEDQFPCASWLPVLCQNPAEYPQTWQEFCQEGQPSPRELLMELRDAIEREIGLTPEDKIDALDEVKILEELRGNYEDSENKKIAINAIRMLRGIGSDRPTAKQMAEALNNFVIYLRV